MTRRVLVQMEAAPAELANRPGRTFFAGQERHGYGRLPDDKPDVFLHVPELHVGEIHLDVESLDAHLSLQARLANLVELTAGVHVHVGKVELDIKDVEAKALLKVRLENLYNILDRALTTVERNPEILQGLLSTAGAAVESVGQTAQQAVQPGGAVSSLTEGVAAAGREALGPGGVATEAVDSAGRVAEEAVGPGGAAGKAAEGVTDTTSHAAQAGGAAAEAAGAEAAGAADRVAGREGDAVPEATRDTRRNARDTRHAAAPGSRQPGQPGTSGRFGRQSQSTEMTGKPMAGAESGQPTVELEVAVQAGEMRFREPGDVSTQSAGMTHVVRDSRREGVPWRVRPDVTYSDVRVSFRIAAWLDEPGESACKLVNWRSGPRLAPRPAAGFALVRTRWPIFPR